MDFENLLAQRTRKMGASAIREILKVVSLPGVISLAGGIPAPESFPMEIISELTARVIDKYASTAFQYDLTEGFTPLRKALAEHLQKKGIHATPDDVIVTTGSQGLLEAIGKILISRGDRVAVEAPTYLGAIQAFNSYEPDYIRLDMDDDGLIPDSLEEVLQTGGVKFVYIVPTFQNPSGRTTTLERREKIAEIIRKYNALLVEDDPYSDLRYRGKPLQAIQTLIPENVVYTSTFSKIFAPGLRIGFCVAPALIKKWLVLAKQGIDLHTSTFNQALAAEYLSGGYLERHLPKILSLYKPRQEAMLEAMDKYFPSSFKWSKPEGGMFIWAEGPRGLDMECVYVKSVERKAAFVPGKFFFAHSGDGLETMRLNYTMTNEENIDRAIEIISGVIKEDLC